METAVELFQPADLSACLELLNRHIETGTANFSWQPETEASLTRSFEEAVAGPYVAKANGEVIGYALAHPAFSKEAYRYCAELTIYFKEGPHYGLARPLYQAVEEELRAKDFVVLIACITDSNAPSLAFHEKLGFTCAGALPRCGYKFGDWHGVVWYTRRLREV